MTSSARSAAAFKFFIIQRRQSTLEGGRAGEDRRRVHNCLLGSGPLDGGGGTRFKYVSRLYATRGCGRRGTVAAAGGSRRRRRRVQR